MADRDRYDRDRGRDYVDYSDRDRGYGRGADRERSYEDRGVMSRGADEVRSWFGDDEARRRREIDEQRDRERGWYRSGDDRQYGANSERVRSEHGWPEPRRSPEWERGQYQPRHADERNWYERGEAQTYGLGAPNWSGAPRREPHDFGRGSSSAPRFPSQPSDYWGGRGGWNAESAGDRSRGYGREFSTTGEGRRDSGGPPSWSAGYGSFAGRGPRNYRRSDERVREDVNERLTADPRVDAWDIDVRVQNGEVTLSGIVADRHTRRLAEEIVEDLPGVRDVKNDLRVGPGMFGGAQEGAEQSRSREDGAIGRTGDPQTRQDVNTLNQTTKITR